MSSSLNIYGDVCDYRKLSPLKKKTKTCNLTIQALMEEYERFSPEEQE
jgi:hypothetical protein